MDVQEQSKLILTEAILRREMRGVEEPDGGAVLKENRLHVKIARIRRVFDYKGFFARLRPRPASR